MYVGFPGGSKDYFSSAVSFQCALSESVQTAHVCSCMQQRLHAHSLKKQKLNADSHTLSFVFRRGREESDAGGCGDDDEQQEA